MGKQIQTLRAAMVPRIQFIVSGHTFVSVTLDNDTKASIIHIICVKKMHLPDVSII